MPEIDYQAAYTAMHEAKGGKLLRGGALKYYVEWICALVQEHKPASLLDYGSGKGHQYLVTRYHETWGGLMPHCYDIGVRGLDIEPEGHFDGVICTDVLEHIAEPDVDGFLENLINYLPVDDETNQPNSGFIFLGISCRPAKKTFPDGQNVHLTVKESKWWIKRVRELITRDFCLYGPVEWLPFRIVMAFDADHEEGPRQLWDSRGELKIAT